MEQQVKTKVQFTDSYNAFTNLENNDGLSTGFGKIHYDLGYLNSENQRQESEINAIAQAGSKNICPIGTETHSSEIGFGTEYSFPMPEGAYIISFTGTMVAPIQFNVYSESGTRIALVDIHTIQEAEAGIRFVLNDNATKCKFWYDTSDNYTLSNIMIRDANITDNTFQPYSPTNRELYNSFRELTVENASQQSEINYAVNTGAKNFCPKETETSTGSGFTSDVPVNIPAGTYILSFTGTLAYTASLSLYKALPHSGNGLGTINLSATTGAQSIEFTISETAKYIAFYHNGSGNSLTNIMIRPAVITDPTFVPYAKTNRELTVENDSQQSEINYAVNTGVKNLFDINTSLPLKIYHSTYTLSNGSLTVTSNGNWGCHSVPVNLPAGNYIFTATISDFSKDPSASVTSVRMRVTDKTATGGIEIASRAVTGNGVFELPFTWTGGLCYIQYYPNFTSTTTYVSSFTASNNMIRPAAITDPTFQSYALPNPTLTPAAIKAVDEGAKNNVYFNSIGNAGSAWSNPYTHNGITYTLLADGTISAYGTASSTENSFCYLGLNNVKVNIDELCDGNHVLAGCPSGGSTSTWRMYVTRSGYGNYSDIGTGVLLPDKSTYSGILVCAFVSKGVTIPQNSPIVFKPMICTAADWAVSQKFVPYAPTNRELYESKLTADGVWGLGTELSANTDLNVVTDIGRYFCTGASVGATLENCPTIQPFVLTVSAFQDVNNKIQRIESLNLSTLAVEIYERMKISSGWKSWYKFEGTVVT